MLAVDIADYRKAIDLVFAIEAQLESSINPGQYLVDICHVLLSVQQQNLTDIASTMLIELGKFYNIKANVIL